MQDFVNGMANGCFDSQFIQLYGNSERELLRQRARYLNAAEKFSKKYPEQDDIRIFSAPGRTEIGGNHTDHQHGCVLAAAINLDIAAFVSLNVDSKVRICSEGHEPFEIDIKDLEPKEEEKESPISIVKGILSVFSGLDAGIGGFNACIFSEIPEGGGLSSSAAFEVLIGTIINSLFYDGKLSTDGIAKTGHYAENEYYGKSSGLMDQMVSAVGGFAVFDFFNPIKPVIKNIAYDFSGAGYSLCVTETNSTNTKLTDEYSTVSDEMKSVASELGCEVLREADEDIFFSNLTLLREKCSDRAILRSAHFFAENNRALLEAEALEQGDTEEFFRLVNESGESSVLLLQNLFSEKSPQIQEIPLAIMLSKRRLNGSGAVRVHGGGFAGTVQAFVPTYLVDYYVSEMNSVFGDGSCKILRIRSLGACEIKL